ncbi:MAG: DUF4291 domain-containing protein [Acidipropionibacterium sp.]|jgi:hypothetical protein|nr:DUF4291 domain-containing protein [Acidipropionibacterium sp.]
MNLTRPRPCREVRALFDESTITVYQAYSPAIAWAAVAAQTFVSPFKTDRMSWIKPSFLWMMYRSGWATKPGQERVLAIRITRAGFETALAGAVLSHYESGLYADRGQWLERKTASPVRIQWDPERDLALNPLPWRSLQMGLSGSALRGYLDEWIIAIADITDDVHALRDHPDPAGIPAEEPYPLSEDIAATIGADDSVRE